jgi:hypothetical protein
MSVRRVVSTGVLTLALFAPLSSAGLAHADPVHAPRSQTLKSQAEALRAQVEALQLQQSIATEAYDTAVEDTTTAISEEVRAQSALDAATGDSATATKDATRRVRSLYMSGGSASLTSGISRVLSSGDLDDVDATARGALLARSVVADDTTTVTACEDLDATGE